MDEIKQEVRVDGKKVIKISKKKFIVTIVIILVVLFVGWVLLNISSSRYGASISMEDSIAPSVNSSLGKSSIMPDFNYFPGNQELAISDTREFLKTSYSADIKTRDVKEVVTDVKNIVKGADGRVDNFRSSEKSGYVSFVVAKSKFEAFKYEVEAIAHKKLYTETISSENLLSQKQDIEQVGANIVNSIQNLQSQKEDLNTKHTQTVNAINKELSNIKNELAVIRATITETTDSQILVSLRNQESALMKRDTTERKKLSEENNSYTIQSKNLENLINAENNDLTNNNKQDTQFLDNVETVSGSVYIGWVSLWELATIFSPISPVIIIIILIIILWIVLKKKGVIPKVMFE